MAQIGDRLWFHDAMDMQSTVVSVRPTIFGKRYTIKVDWSNGKYSNFNRIWWRTWL